MFNFIARLSIVKRILPIVAAVLVLKISVYMNGWEYLSLNPLFSSLIAATIFIIGFLISGILSDYKESEKLPGELATSIEAIFDEIQILYLKKKPAEAILAMNRLVDLAQSIKKWFYKEERTFVVYAKISGMNDVFAKTEPLMEPPFANRMKQEQTAVRKAITRIHTIRETEFVTSAYLIAEILSIFLVAGLVFVKIGPFYESLFFVTLVTFLVVYLLKLIKELDNPFDYSPGEVQGDHVSLKPFLDTVDRLGKNVGEISSEGG